MPNPQNSPIVDSLYDRPWQRSEIHTYRCKGQTLVSPSAEPLAYLMLIKLSAIVGRKEQAKPRNQHQRPPLSKQGDRIEFEQIQRPKMPEIFTAGHYHYRRNFRPAGLKV